jgi:hypothetical protein
MSRASMGPCHRRTAPVPTIRIRLTGSRDDADTLLTTLHGIDGIEHVEELEEPSMYPRDDSSSSDLVDDNGSELFLIEVQAADGLHADAVRAVTEVEVSRLGAVVEFVDEF